MSKITIWFDVYKLLRDAFRGKKKQFSKKSDYELLQSYIYNAYTYNMANTWDKNVNKQLHLQKQTKIPTIP